MLRRLSCPDCLGTGTADYVDDGGPAPCLTCGAVGYTEREEPEFLSRREETRRVFAELERLEAMVAIERVRASCR